MKNLREILAKSSEIISLAKRFGFDSEVQIFHDVGSLRSDMFLLDFLVRVAPGKEPTVYHTTLLSVKLTEVLQSTVIITMYEGVEDLYKSWVTKRSLSLTASENEFCKLFEVNDMEKIFFKKPSKHVRDVLLKEANKYLDEHPAEPEKILSSPPAVSKKTSNFENLKGHTLLPGSGEESHPKKRKDDSHSPNEDSTVSPPKNQSPRNTRK